jgi:hypothetical protein
MGVGGKGYPGGDRVIRCLVVILDRRNVLLVQVDERVRRISLKYSHDKGSRCAVDFFRGDSLPSPF